MKKIFLILLLPVVLFLSCNKEYNHNYYFRFKADGTDKNYTGYILAHLEDLGSGDFELTILGAPNANSFDDYLGIYINNSPGGGTITAGQYNDNSTTRVVLSTYGKGTIGYEAGTTMYEEAVANNVTITNHFTGNITELNTSGNARGTFSGDYYPDGDIHGTKISITNGEFYVKFQ
jgi:hypothetical protein